MTHGAQVCDRCRGRGYIYKGHGLRGRCPACAGRRPRASQASARQEALFALAECLRNHEAGNMSSASADDQLGETLRAALQAGWTVEQLHAKLGLSRQLARRLAQGQQTL